MLEFDSIFFDSEPLVGSRWPHISGTLRIILNWARSYGVRLYLPLATEMELEEHWYREFEAKCSDIDVRSSRLRRSYPFVDMRGLVINIPDEGTARTQYRDTVQQVKDAWEIETLPLTRRGVDEFFRLAITQSPPFKEEGAGFQDTVIFFSVIDYLRETGRAGAYVSNDGIFKKHAERILEIARSSGVQLRLYRTIADLEKAFHGQLEDDIKAALDRHIQLAYETLNARIPLIEEFIARNIEIPKQHIPVGDVIAVERIEVVSIEYVVTSFPKDGEPTNISFNAVIKAHVLLDTSPYKFFRQIFDMKTGVKSLEVSADIPATKPHELKYRVEVEASGSFNEGRFTRIELLSAKMKS